MEPDSKQANAGSEKTETITSFIFSISDYAVIYNSFNFDIYDAKLFTPSDVPNLGVLENQFIPVFLGFSWLWMGNSKCNPVYNCCLVSVLPVRGGAMLLPDDNTDSKINVLLVLGLKNIKFFQSK